MTLHVPKYRGCGDILLGPLCHLHVSFFILVQKLFSKTHAYNLYIAVSVHVAFQLSPWLALSNLTSFSHGEIEVLLPAPEIVILGAGERVHIVLG